MSNQNYFIHFGCWNNGGCPKDNDLTKVLNKINSLTDKPEFLSICGDNYYPTVEKIKGEGKQDLKKKRLQMDNLLSGFNCLPKDIEIFMTYGNHDFETNLFINDTEREDQCTLTKSEISIVNETFQNIHLKLFQSTQIGNNTKILFLDTTLYDDSDIEESAQCYKIIDEKYVSIDIAKNDQLEFIRNFVNNDIDENVKNIIIIGHHPLAQYKIKKEKMKFIIVNPVFNDILYNEIFTPLKNKDINYFYLCADLHQYQSGNIVINGDMRLKQYIVGTAGAKKDEVNKDMYFKEPQSESNIQYFMDESDIETSTDKSGYLNCILDGDIMRFEFKSVDNDLNTSIGGKRRTRRLRQRGRKMRKTLKRNKRSRNRKVYGR
jgi:hypothetical protein